MRDSEEISSINVEDPASAHNTEQVSSDSDGENAGASSFGNSAVINDVLEASFGNSAADKSDNITVYDTRQAAAALCQVSFDSAEVFTGAEQTCSPSILTASTDTDLTSNRLLSNDPLDSLALDNHAVHGILEHFFQMAQDHCLYSIVAETNLDADAVVRALYGEKDSTYPLELCLAVLAIAIEVSPAHLGSSIQMNKNVIVDTLRIEFLRRIPPLAWKSTEINLYQCIALCLASFTWCLNEHIAEIAARWNGIAQVILNTLGSSEDAGTLLRDKNKYGPLFLCKTLL